jgi:hypothetical protein
MNDKLTQGDSEWLQSIGIVGFYIDMENSPESDLLEAVRHQLVDDVFAAVTDDECRLAYARFHGVFAGESVFRADYIPAALRNPERPRILTDESGARYAEDR